MDDGLATRLAELRADVELAIVDYPPGDTRLLIRLYRRLDRLHNPDLKLLARLGGGCATKTLHAKRVIAPSPEICNRASRSYPA